jgi:hypothetical protein
VGDINPVDHRVHGVLPDVVLWLPKWLLPQSVGCFPNPSGTGFICPR